MNIVGKIGETTETGEVTFEWKISDFFSLSDRVNDCYHSTVISFADSRWCLRLYPNGETAFSSTGSVGLYIMKEDSGASQTVYFTFGIKGTGGVENKGEVTKEFRDGKGWGIPKCWSRFELRDRKSSLMPNNVLTITCHLRHHPTNTIKHYSDSSTQTDSNLELEVLPEVKQPSEKEGSKELKESLKKLLAGGEHNDCVIKVRGKEFPAHRALLCARSPVFRAMFAHDTFERQSNVVTIEDCNPEVFLAFLEHVYTGSDAIISSKNAFGLYEASEKYDLPALKKACSEFLKQNLTVASFCEAITLAVKYGDKELLEVATEFYCGNTLDLVQTAEWQNFVAENPTVGNELLI